MDGLQPAFSYLCGHLLGALGERIDAQVREIEFMLCRYDTCFFCFFFVWGFLFV